MVKLIYETPSAQTLELCTESALLALSDPTKNPYYLLDDGGEDDEFI